MGFCVSLSRIEKTSDDDTAPDRWIDVQGKLTTAEAIEHLVATLTALSAFLPEKPKEQTDAE